MEVEGMFRRFDILVHWDSPSFARHGTTPDLPSTDAFGADLGRIAFTRRKKGRVETRPFSLVVYLPQLFGARNECGCKIETTSIMALRFWGSRTAR